MKKIVLLCLILLCVSNILKAENSNQDIYFKIGPSYSKMSQKFGDRNFRDGLYYYYLPSDNTTDKYNGYGISSSFEFLLEKKYGLGMEFEYLSFSDKEDNLKEKYDTLLYNIYFKYVFLENKSINPFLGINFGFLSQDLKVNGYNEGLYDIKLNDSNFYYGLLTGVNFVIDKKINFEFTLKYIPKINFNFKNTKSGVYSDFTYLTASAESKISYIIANLSVKFKF